MTLYDAIKFNQELITRLFEAGMKPGDWEYTGLYGDYLQMCADGEKVTWIVSELAGRYKVSERKVWGILKRMGQDCTGRAA